MENKFAVIQVFKDDAESMSLLEDLLDSGYAIYNCAPVIGYTEYVLIECEEYDEDEYGDDECDCECEVKEIEDLTLEELIALVNKISKEIEKF